MDLFGARVRLVHSHDERTLDAATDAIALTRRTLQSKIKRCSSSFSFVMAQTRYVASY